MFTPVKRCAAPSRVCEDGNVCLCRIGAQRFLSTGAVSAFKSEKLHGGFPAGSGNNDDPSLQERDIKGPFLSQDSVWRNDMPVSFGIPFGNLGGAAQFNATQPGLQTHLQLLQAAAKQQMEMFPPMLSTQVTNTHHDLTQMRFQETLAYEDHEQLGLRELTAALLSPPTSVANEVCSEQPALDMEAFLQVWPSALKFFTLSFRSSR